MDLKVRVVARVKFYGVTEVDGLAPTLRPNTNDATRVATANDGTSSAETSMVQTLRKSRFPWSSKESLEVGPDTTSNRRIVPLSVSKKANRGCSRVSLCMAPTIC